MYRALFATAFFAATLSLSTTGAEAAKRVCAERAKLTKFLSTKYSEQARSVGVADSGSAVVEIFTSDKGSWTLLMTTANGKSCIIGAGHS